MVLNGTKSSNENRIAEERVFSYESMTITGKEGGLIGRRRDVSILTVGEYSIIVYFVKVAKFDDPMAFGC